MRQPVIYRRDVRAVIRAVAPTDVAAVVPVPELYRVYRGQMDEQGREPVSRNMFGRAMSQCGQPATMKKVDGHLIRHRVVHERFMASEEFDTELARLSHR